MEGIDSLQVSTDEGSTSSSKTAEGLMTDGARSEGGQRLMGMLLESPVAPTESSVEEGQFEPVSPPSPPTPRNPLAALAVYVDVNFPSAFQMLRTAASATMEEAKAILFSGSNGRFSITRRLHQRLEELWTRPCRHLMNANFDNVRLLLGSLQHKVRRCKLGTPTLANPTGEELTISRIEEAATDLHPNAEGSSQSELSANLMDCLSSDNDAFSADSLPTAWRPVRRHDGTFIAPPLELLAAFADPRSRSITHRNRCSFTPECLELWSSTQKTASDSTVACVVGLCVRSLLDLYIQAIRSLQPALLPKGSVVLVSAVNVPMMFRVLEEHHLIVQPLDLDPHTLMPTEQSLQQGMQFWGSRVKAVLCSHLYGGLCDIQPLVDFSAKHKLLLIEDCAESFVGELYRGHPWADVSLFSFGLIKTCTAAGGGIATVRGFPSTGELFKLLRFQPNSSLLAVILKRLDSWNLKEFIEQQLRTTRFARRLQYLGFHIPGCDAAFKTFWLFPVLTPHGWTASEFEAVLRENGLFAASDATTLVCCTSLPCNASGAGYPKTAAEVMRRIVYLPVNRNSTQQQLLQVEAAVARASGCEPSMLMQ
ncbi:hypothetical protein, conserved [Eimeria praecox]|uniref:Uncharacterized protein n=1 Tax=Eimeria praecox TaxID=51316 RepID=U6H0T6_9EIME|nr:hypothetical protein, conserved [Eimeria praecox]